MTVVGVWGRDARDLCRRRLPGAHRWAQVDDALICASGDELREHEATIGQLPTTSSMRVAEDGLVLERGAAWTAPIYYRVDAPIASSNVAPLINDDDDLDPRRLASMTAYAVHRRETRTAFRAIRVVEPYETVRFDARGRTSSVRAIPRLETLGRASVDDLAQELRRRLFGAVERTIGNKRIGLMISGGIDSSTILAVLVAIRGAPDLACATLDFDAPGSDQPYVKALEDHFGISVVRMRPSTAPSADALILDGSPSRHHGDMWIMVGARAVHARGAKLLLTGTGGDGFFGSDYGIALYDAVSHADLRGALMVLQTRFPHRFSLRARAGVSARAVLRPFVPMFLRRRRVPRFVAGLPDWVGPLLRDEFEQLARERAERRPARSAQERFEDTVTNAAESEYCAEARAQTDTASPIPRADPLYDDSLVQFLTAIRQEKLFVDSSYRGLVRRAMRGLLPDKVRERVDKSDFEPALAQAMWPIERFEPLLGFERIGAMGIVNVESFRKYIAPLYDAPSAERNAARWTTFYPALAMEAFLRTT